VWIYVFFMPALGDEKESKLLLHVRATPYINLALYTLPVEDSKSRCVNMGVHMAQESMPMASLSQHGGVLLPP
jgi:hypothetical protein